MTDRDGRAPGDVDLGRVVEQAVRGALNYRGPLDDAEGVARALEASYRFEQQGDEHRAVRYVPAATTLSLRDGSAPSIGPMARFHDQAETARDLVRGLLEQVRLADCCGSAEQLPDLVRDIREQLDSVVAVSAEFPVNIARLNATLTVVSDLLRAVGAAVDYQERVARDAAGASSAPALAAKDRLVRLTRVIEELTSELAKAATTDSPEESYYAHLRPRVELLLRVLGTDVAEYREALHDVGVDEAEQDLVVLDLHRGGTLTVRQLLRWLEELASAEGPRALAAGPVFAHRELRPAVGVLAEAALQLECAPSPYDEPSPTRLARRLVDRLSSGFLHLTSIGTGPLVQVYTETSGPDEMLRLHVWGDAVHEMADLEGRRMGPRVVWDVPVRDTSKPLEFCVTRDIGGPNLSGDRKVAAHQHLEHVDLAAGGTQAHDGAATASGNQQGGV